MPEVLGYKIGNIRGTLTGKIKSYEDLPENKFRKMLAGFQPENFETNLKLFKEIQKMVKEKNCTSAQVALGRVRSLSKREGMPETFQSRVLQRRNALRRILRNLSCLGKR